MSSDPRNSAGDSGGRRDADRGRAGPAGLLRGQSQARPRLRHPGRGGDPRQAGPPAQARRRLPRHRRAPALQGALRRRRRDLAALAARRRPGGGPSRGSVLTMLARLCTTALVGLAAHPVGVEVDIGRGLPSITVVGLGDAAVLQARDRIRAAFANSGFDWPDRRITISLPPADLPKQGAGFDLPIAVGLLAAAGLVPVAGLARLWAVGELGLGGDLRPVRGVLAAALAARAGGAGLLLVPRGNLAEAALVPGVAVAGATSLAQVAGWLGGRGGLEAAGPARTVAPTAAVEDLAEVRGQPLARRLGGLLPALGGDEALEVTQVLSAAGLLGADAGLVTTRPFRAPHHTISVAGLVGGGSRVPRPGEASLAHHGVLFLDELAEFPRAALEALRQPLESGEVTVVRSGACVRFPARFALVAACNPCPCGYLGDGERPCRCGPEELRRYARRLSGPLLDRVDLYVRVERVGADELGPGVAGE